MEEVIVREVSYGSFIAYCKKCKKYTQAKTLYNILYFENGKAKTLYSCCICGTEHNKYIGKYLSDNQRKNWKETKNEKDND